MTHSEPRHGTTTARAARRGQRGQGLVEMALLMPLVVSLLVGLVELSRVQRWQVTLTAAAHSGALYASESTGNAEDTSGVQERVLAEIDELSDLGDGHSTPTVQVALGAATADGFGKQQVTVTVGVSVPPLFRIAGFPTAWTLQETASARVLEQQPAS
jgi:Flp pilus assembly protein TadG